VSVSGNGIEGGVGWKPAIGGLRKELLPAPAKAIHPRNFGI
jgi:hypothetical protein